MGAWGEEDEKDGKGKETEEYAPQHDLFSSTDVRGRHKRLVEASTNLWGVQRSFAGRRMRWGESYERRGERNGGGTGRSGRFEEEGVVDLDDTAAFGCGEAHIFDTLREAFFDALVVHGGCLHAGA